MTPDFDRSDRTLTPAKRARLVEFLAALPPGAASKLFAALETDRARGGAGLPHEFLLEALRRELAAKDARFPPRPKSAERLFFAPFEDFFIAFRAGKKRRARIARSSIHPIWKLLTGDPAAASAGRAADALSQAIRENANNLTLFEDTLFAAAGQGLQRLLAHAAADSAFRADLVDRLGGAEAFDDMKEIAALLSTTSDLKALQSAFPRPVQSLTEEDLFEARRLYAAARAKSEDAAPYLLLALMGRMEAPWRALRVYYHLAGSSDGALGPASEESRVILDALFEDLESAARLLVRDSEGAFDASDAELHLAHFIEFAEGLGIEAERAGDRAVENRVEAARDLAGGALERFAEQALAALRKAMPVRHAGGSSRLMALRPDVARGLPPRAFGGAREAAAFLAKSGDLARRLRRPDAAAPIVKDAREELRRYAGDLVLEIRAAEGEDRVAARRLMDSVLDIALPLVSGDDIALLKDRAQAAALTA